ncbi:S8 family peptidase [Luteimonas mephitis]|uniref:S8 family peptidase n=1 Tax=Luteimonas mephitis TaxID=83615 RepID=UPI00042708E2|nr:S8 family peptidase [Luteimonas mephitis]
MSYVHLRLGRETPSTERHPKNFPGIRPPADLKEHGRNLGTSLRRYRQQLAEQDIGGFDDRKLIKIRLRDGDKMLPELELIAGVEIVSQEEDTIVLAFASEQGLGEFESRLSTLARDGSVTRKDLFYAIADFERWAPEDRMGAALREQGFPDTDTFKLDVELWPQDRQDHREAMVGAFEQLLVQSGIEKLDKLVQQSLVMVRVRCTRAQAEQLLNYRDVRTVDLPPRLGVSIRLLLTDVNQFPQVVQPAVDAPAVAVLDSGLTSGHSLLGVAVGDAQGYLAPDYSPDDASPWHGTFVSGVALYGDVQASIQRGQFVPQVRLFSGRVFEDDQQDQTEFVEKAVEAAVRELQDEYGCRVFNLSYGDLNKIYDGRHVRGLAYTLDRLTRELGVLFVVPTGNLREDDLPDDPRNAYPTYLSADNARLIDPATALNALTVGGLSLNEATRNAQRQPNMIEDRLLARAGQPFPLTRRGPSINGAIKPDVVEHAGNVALRRVGQGLDHRGLGVVSLNGGFAAGPAFSEDIGTSYAAPKTAHKAARLLREIPGASHNLLRALIGAHARWTEACLNLFNPQTNAQRRDSLLQLIGYGHPDESALFRSLDHSVTLLAEERVDNDQNHFYELPVPESFWSGGRRVREITVALAYSPAVRTTRLDYRRTKLWFTLVNASTLDEVTRAFQRNREEGMGERTTGRSIPNGKRKAGTLQVSRWTFRDRLALGQKVFVVVTRQDAQWSNEKESDEPYALVSVLAERGVVSSQLYTDVNITLQARARARARV